MNIKLPVSVVNGYDIPIDKPDHIGDGLGDRYHEIVAADLA